MNFEILHSLQFEREFKRLVRKYPSLKKEYADLIPSLEKNPTQGVAIGQNCYKIRIPIASKGKGKSGGARVITCILQIEKIVYLVSIYDKAEKENISDKDLEKAIKEI